MNQEHQEDSTNLGNLKKGKKCKIEKKKDILISKDRVSAQEKGALQLHM